jgi:hypothetical protein
VLLPTPSWTVFGARKDMRAASSSSAPRVLAAPGMMRPDLVTALFLGLDGDGDGVLSCNELFVFAQLTGYDEIPGEWGAEYVRLCSDYGCTGRGIDLAVLTQLVNDPGRQLSNTELEEALRNLVGPAAARAAAQAAREAAHAARRPMLALVAKQRPAVAKRRPCWRPQGPAAKASAIMCWDSRHRFASSRSPSSVHRRWGTRPGRRVRKWTEDLRYLATVMTVLSGWPLQSFPEIL